MLTPIFLFLLWEQSDPTCPTAASAVHSIRDKFNGILVLMPDGFLLLLLISKNEITTFLGCNGCSLSAWSFLAQLHYCTYNYAASTTVWTSTVPTSVTPLVHQLEVRAKHLTRPQPQLRLLAQRHTSGTCNSKHSPAAPLLLRAPGGPRIWDRRGVHCPFPWWEDIHLGV